MAILTTDDFDEIRAALDVGLDSSNLKDELIDLTIYRGAADADVLRLDPLAETYTDADKKESIRRAAIFFCAARLTSAVVRLTSQTVQTRDVSYQKAWWDPEEKAAELRGLAEDEIEDVIGDLTFKSGLITITREDAYTD